MKGTPSSMISVRDVNGGGRKRSGHLDHRTRSTFLHGHEDARGVLCLGITGRDIGDQGGLRNEVMVRYSPMVTGGCSVVPFCSPCSAETFASGPPLCCSTGCDMDYVRRDQNFKRSMLEIRTHRRKSKSTCESRREDFIVDALPGQMPRRPRIATEPGVCHGPALQIPGIRLVAAAVGGANLGEFVAVARPMSVGLGGGRR